jgi:hypothetical protein
MRIVDLQHRTVGIFSVREEIVPVGLGHAPLANLFGALSEIHPSLGGLGLAVGIENVSYRKMHVLSFHAIDFLRPNVDPRLWGYEPKRRGTTFVSRVLVRGSLPV